MSGRDPRFAERPGTSIPKKESPSMPLNIPSVKCDQLLLFDANGQFMDVAKMLKEIHAAVVTQKVEKVPDAGGASPE